MQDLVEHIDQTREGNGESITYPGGRKVGGKNIILNTSLFLLEK